MSLKILVKSASGLPNRDSIGTSDPYVTVCFQGEKQKTKVQKATLDPVWDELLTWTLGTKKPRADEVIECVVKDYERIGWNKLLGKTSIPLRNLLQGQKGFVELDQQLLGTDDQPTTACLHLSIEYSPPSGQTTVVKPQPGQTTAAIPSSGTASAAAPLDYGVVPQMEIINEVKSSGGMPYNLYSTGSSRSSLSNVITKFQVRVRVVEARQLLGENMSPVCRVSLGNKVQQTKVLKSTANPWFDEIFFFHQEVLPTQLMADFLEFKVCNSRVLRSASVIGSFKCEVGRVYEQENHAFVNRWLVLASEGEPTPTVQGYLKVSITVLGPGDICPDISASRNLSDDVESNVLWSGGVHLQPASFVVTVYCAENLPRMDSGAMQILKEALGWTKESKGLVDPYLVSSYAGKEVQTRIHYGTDHPEFRQQLHLGFLFPSMCNSLQLRLMDWDRIGDDDVIGQATIPVHAISTPGENGFLPTFGPSYVNLYGARREWEFLEGKASLEMSAGEKEGCAYRGRVLVSVSTNVGSYPSSPATTLDEHEFQRVKHFRHTRGFVVIAHLSHVTLLKEAHRPLDIEISMGNFGNKLENSALPSPSSTHPCNSQFDGCKHYFLPWGEASPLIILQCQWEDITYRLHDSNAIMSVLRTLKKGLEPMKREALCRKQNSETCTKTLEETINRLCEDCSHPFLEVDLTRHTLTSLDVQLRNYRIRELESMAELGKSLLELDPLKAIDELEGMAIRLERLALEPQSSMPDIFMWLMSGTQRIAFTRIPAADILYSREARRSGYLAGRFHTYCLEAPEYKTDGSIGGIVTASFWLGREEEMSIWWSTRADLQLTVYAETYENQAVAAPGTGKWTCKGALLRRPPFSDADGIQSLPKESFVPAGGWQFQGEWIVDPDPSVKFSVDMGHTVFVDEVFQQQIRVPGGTWVDAPTTWADIRGDPAIPREEIECPPGWKWRDVWATDVQRAVDGEGWEYTVQKGITGWSPFEKLYHLIRRRRWIRERVRVGKVDKESHLVDGWEYSSLFSNRFHARQRSIDLVRRRRWRRKMVPADPVGTARPAMIFVKEAEEKENIAQVTTPRQYVISSEQHKFHLRAHIYQARDVAAGDKSGFSDPFAIVSFLDSSQQSEKQCQTLCPTWDQTLIFSDVVIAGALTPDGLIGNPPDVVVEVYDWDARGSPDFLGRAFCQPQVYSHLQDYKQPKLQWYPLFNGSDSQGELLAAFELLLKSSEEMPMPPPSRGDLFMVPFGIRPLLQKTRIEILCWGLRNMAPYELQSVSRPSVEFECGGRSIISQIIPDIRVNPNFDSPHLTLDVELPKEEIYMPSLTIRVLDHRAFGSKPVVASAVINGIHRYSADSNVIRKDMCMSTPLLSASFKWQKASVDKDIDWWSKYYASTNEFSRSGSYLQKGYKTIEVLRTTLEDDPRYCSFKDLVDTITLYRGKGQSSNSVGEFKGTFRVYSLSIHGNYPTAVLSGFPSPGPCEIIARVYIVAGFDLAPKDSGGSSDPYVVVSLGKEKKSGRENFKAGTLNPVFGCIFELKGCLPLTKDIKIAVWDRDQISSDDLIGETTIDLENRFLSRHRASVGLPKQYHMSGPNMWRELQKPSEILQEVATWNSMTGPEFTDMGTSLSLNGKSYQLSQFEPKGTILPTSLGEEKERLSLHVLRAAFNFVCEHVEERPLFHPERPGLEQGRIHMWVDLFPAVPDIPPPVDVAPRIPAKYVLRIVVYNTYEVPLQETNIAGERMSDVYIKGWLQGMYNVQKTDTHYRCLDGEANFNWRFVFPFDYMEGEQCMVITTRKSILSSHKCADRRPPQITLQLWDNDLISRDDYLGEMTLDLCRIPKPAKSTDKVKIENVCLNANLSPRPSDEESTTGLLPADKREPTYVNLFEVKRLYGYFPFTSLTDGCINIAGKLEAEVEVLTEEEANLRPAGYGRDEPNMNPTLPKPNRPATSFFWLSSPWKSFRYVLWKNYKWHIITVIILFFLFLFAFLFLYSLPSATIDYLILK